MIGKARCLEARNELAKAIEQYELVVKNWPDSPEAEQAKKLAEALKKPEAAAFYKELYAYNPPKVTLPPLGNERLNFPGRTGGIAASSPARPAPAADSPGRWKSLRPTSVKSGPHREPICPRTSSRPKTKAAPKAPR